MFLAGDRALTQIAILTPAADDPAYKSHWPVVLERLSTALAMADVSAVPTAWTDHVEDASNLTGYPLVLGVLTWGYYERHADWLAATKLWGEAGVRIANPASVLGWNSDKSYLRRLETAGIPIPPTAWSDQVTQAEIDAAFGRFGTDTLVVKPTVSGGAWKTVKLSRGETLVDAPDGAAMIQPFLPSVSCEGEISLLHFDGVFSHAIGKVAKAGDFRVQPQFGSTIGPISPPPGALEVARAVLAAAPGPLTYARIDLIRHPDGSLRLMELEAIEPDLFLEHALEAGAVFAAAVKRAVG